MQSERTTGKGNCKITHFKIAHRSFILCPLDLKLVKDSNFTLDKSVIVCV